MIIMTKALLPINAMIILVMGVLVLVGVLALFSGVWRPAASGTAIETIKSVACNKYLTGRCEATTIQIGQEVVCGTTTFSSTYYFNDTFCSTCYGIGSCHHLCGCP